MLEGELWRRLCERFTPEFLATSGGIVHAKCLELLKSIALNIILLCSRRAGKTEFACRLLLQTSMATANVSSLYLAIVGPQAQKVWFRKWKPFLRKMKVPCRNDETLMQTVFPNGSVVQFGGVDDARHAASLLGDSMAGGVCIVDECQSQPAVVQELVEDVLEPMLSETTAEKPIPGRMVLSGTIPKIKAGYFWDLFAAGLVDNKIANDNGDEWERHNFTRWDNPFLTDNRARLDATLRKFKWTEDHPTIQRDWFGRWDIANDVTAIHYRRDLAGWLGTVAPWGDQELPPGKLIAMLPPPEIDVFGIGADPAATADRFAVVLIGWSRLKPAGVWEIAEWVTERGADALESQWIEVIKFFKWRYGKIAKVIRDAGSASTTNDLLYRSHGIMIEPAIKGPHSRRARVDRLDDLVSQQRFHPIIGGKLEEDFQRATWSVKARRLGRWDWDSSWHPDVLDAASYILPAYYEAIGLVSGPQPSGDVALQKIVEVANAKSFASTAAKAPPKVADTKSIWSRNKW